MRRILCKTAKHERQHGRRAVEGSHAGIIALARVLGMLAGMCLAIVSCSLWGAEAKPNAAWSVQWQPAQLVNGSPVLFRVRPAVRLKTLSGKWLEHQISFALDPKTRVWN